MATELDFDWYKESYLPIVADLQGDDHSVLVIDIETGQIGNIDIELQEFDLLADDIDVFFSELMKKLKESGYPNQAESLYEIPTADELNYLDQQKALEAEEEHRRLNDQPSPEQLFIWAKELFRHQGDPQYGQPNLHIMRLAKSYFDQIPVSSLSKKEVREIAFFNNRYQQMIRP